MTVEEIEIAAYNGEPMPKYLAQPGQLCYLSYRTLYNALRRGEVEKNEAVKEKKNIKKTYEQGMHLYSLWSEGYAQQQKRIKDANAIIVDINKTVKNGKWEELFLKASKAISLLTGDTTSFKIANDWAKKENDNDNDTRAKN